MPQVVSKYFGAHNYNVVTNPKVHVEIDDARHFILTTKQKFDAVTSDPLDPWVKGAATLYTKEFFEVVKEHLNPGGVVTLFVQLYESNTEAVKSEVATFFQAFPNGVVFGNTNNGARLRSRARRADGHDEDRRRRDRAAARSSPQYAQVAQSLREIGFNSATELFATFAGNEPMLRPWLADAQINHDRNLRLQFLAGLGLNRYDQAGIYSQMLQYRRYPDGLFSASPRAARADPHGDGWSGVSGKQVSGRWSLVTGYENRRPETCRPNSRRLSFPSCSPPPLARSISSGTASRSFAEPRSRSVRRRFRDVRAALLRAAADAGVRARLSRERRREQPAVVAHDWIPRAGD